MRPLSPSWDIWALSVIAFEALCGCQPFSGADHTELQSAILGLDFPEVSSLIPGAPTRWQEFFIRAFAPVEGERPASVAVFWAELQECLGSTLAEGAAKEPPSP
jgi:serine/threonine protein kinase